MVFVDPELGGIEQVARRQVGRTTQPRPRAGEQRKRGRGKGDHVRAPRQLAIGPHELARPGGRADHYCRRTPNELGIQSLPLAPLAVRAHLGKPGLHTMLEIPDRRDVRNVDRHQGAAEHPRALRARLAQRIAEGTERQGSRAAEQESLRAPEHPPWQPRFPYGLDEGHTRSRLRIVHHHLHPGVGGIHHEAM